MTFISFVFITALIAFISWLKTKDEENSAKGYFLAGRGLTATVIGFSMVLTSLSTEQLVGVNASSYASNFSIIAWTVQSVIPLCVLAIFLLPRYLKGGFTTIPEFFEERYDKQTRQIMSLLFLVAYTFVMIPGALYSGAIAFTQIFDVEAMFGVSFNVALWSVVWLIGIIGGIYAIFGGLKAVAVSDTLNGFALIIGGAMIPFFALKYLGEGSMAKGVEIVTTTHIDKLTAWGGVADPVPWTTIFTGILIVNFFYWTTNQAIIQRSLAAKSLAEGQKGILYAGVFLLFLPFLLNVPGLVSFHIFGDSIKTIDLAYPMLVSKVLPKPLLGFFTACLFGAILSTFNSFINSAATLFCYDIYRPMFKKDISDEDLIKVAKIAGTIIAIVSMIIAPLLQYGTGGLFLLLKRFAGFFNIPIVALVAVGFLNKTVSGKAARIVVLLHVILYYSLVWIFKVQINFTHVMGGLFVFDIIAMFILGSIFKRETPYVPSTRNKSNVDLSDWKYVREFSALLIIGLAYLYAVLSPIGLAGGNGLGRLTGIFVVLTVIILFIINKTKKRNN
ncbi:solute:sodium symporter family transporter [Fusobacterium mortiferum]|uniref:solute:sodium symporter family transporter n=1 Tax=Fusobacterium mortiferum TaxID=850 RepID=UPI001F27EA5A|nr:solute:sodium symporter family transporter [Fusobacterium mortiferum]MCF2626508.1 solute:sodium symporter family transporter [Fusobacterium mortiferum]